jgi:hypothetical protein
MRTAAAVVLALALSNAAFAVDGAPSRQVLAEMGLSGMQVMSDDEAAKVRGAGFVGWDGFDMFQDALKDYRKQVKHFEKLVKKFDHKISNWPPKQHDPKPPKHDMKPPKHDMKPPKMPHGGGGMGY